MKKAERVATDFLMEAVAALSAAARRPNAERTTLYDLADEAIGRAVAVLAAQRALGVEVCVMSSGRLALAVAVAEAHALACWNALVKHCEAGRCNCHLGYGVSEHILNGCEAGRMLLDEYTIASTRVRNFIGNEPWLPLEAGDFGSTTEVDHIDEYRADPTFRIRTFRKRK